MRLSLTILSLFTCTALTAQCRPGIDTVKAKMDIKVGTNVWDYFEADGKPLWKGVKGYDSTCVAVVAEMLDSKKKRIKGFLIFHGPYN